MTRGDVFLVVFLRARDPSLSFFSFAFVPISYNASTCSQGFHGSDCCCCWGNSGERPRNNTDPSEMHLVLTFSPWMIFRTVHFHPSTLDDFFHDKKNVRLRTARICIQSSLYVIVDYTFPLINIACALCANEDDAAAAFRDSFPAKIRSVHLHRRLVCVRGLVKRTSRLVAARLEASPPCGARCYSLDPYPASCNRQQPVSTAAAAAAAFIR